MAKLEKAIPLITTALFCFAVGAAAGIAWMTSAGYKVSRGNTQHVDARVPAHMPGPMMMSNPKNQLAALIIKLDLITSNKLTIELSEERRARIREILEGVEDSVIHDEIISERLRDLLEVLDEDRQTFISIGYRWPNVPYQRPGMESDPFQYQPNLDHLQSLREKLGGEPTSNDVASMK
jgi:hypothetical protein